MVWTIDMEPCGILSNCQESLDIMGRDFKSKEFFAKWSTDTSIRSSNLLDEMRTQKYFQDSRVETILLPYASPFSL